MSIAFRVELPFGRYEAGLDDPRLAEWPPHPARLHCALLAGHITREHVDALRWLERQPAPEIWAEPEPAGSSCRSGFVPTNRVRASGGSQFHLGRTSQARRRAGAALGGPGFAVVWPHSTPDEAHVEALRELARRIPYLGRAECTAVVSLITSELTVDPAWRCFTPTDGPGEVELRTPYPGYTDALLRVFDDGGRAWEVAHRIGYRLVPDQQPDEEGPPLLTGPHDELITFAMPPGAVLDGLVTGMVTSRCRSVVLGKVGRAAGGAIPPTISGHGADGVPHVAFLPLLDVDHPHARGHLLGVGIALPADQPDTRAALLAGFGADLSMTLRLPFGELALRPASERLRLLSHPRTSRLAPAYWRRARRQWASVTPVVLDHFPRRRDDLADEVARCCLRAGYPAPSEVVVSAGPLVRGGAPMRRRHLARQENRPRLFTHAVVSFPDPVRGPVLLGAQRHLGIGLFAPLPQPEVREQTVGA